MCQYRVAAILNTNFIILISVIFVHCKKPQNKNPHTCLHEAKDPLQLVVYRQRVNYLFFSHSNRKKVTTQRCKIKLDYSIQSNQRSPRRSLNNRYNLFTLMCNFILKNSSSIFAVTDY